MNDTTPIYVDTLMPCQTSERWPFEQACHLFTVPGAEAAKALHRFAKALGLKRQWYQTNGTLPHYDLTKQKRRQAVARGAIEADRAATVEIIRQHRIRRENSLSLLNLCRPSSKP